MEFRNMKVNSRQRNAFAAAYKPFSSVERTTSYRDQPTETPAAAGM
jgi:hypothetical protein